MICKYNRHENAWKSNAAELERLGIDYENNAVLLIDARLIEPYGKTDISGEIRCFASDDDKDTVMPEIKLITSPENTANIVAEINGKTTEYGIPIVFNSLEKLYDVNRIQIVWKIDYNHPGTIPDCIVIDYEVDFNEPVQKGIYGIKSVVKATSEFIQRNEIRPDVKPNNVIINDNNLIEFTDTKYDYNDVIAMCVLFDDDAETANKVRCTISTYDEHSGEHKSSKSDILNKSGEDSLLSILNALDCTTTSTSYYRRKLTVTDNVEIYK